MASQEDTEDGLGSRSLFVTVLQSSLMIALNIVSLLGNVFVCVSVYRNTRLRTTTNIYIVALAISDLFSAIFVMPLASGVLISGSWPFSEAVCQMHAFFSLFVVYISPVTMGFTAVNRYVRICKSDQQYKRFFSKWKSLISLAAAWTFVAFYILIMRFAGLQGFYFKPGYAACLNEHLNNIAKIVHYFVVIGLFVSLPLTVAIFSYKKVGEKIKEHNTALAQDIQQSHGGNTTVSKHEIRISRSLFVVIFAFVLCWIPSWVVTLLERFNVDGMPQNVQLLCSYLVNLSNTINPFIYAGMNPLFRREFRRIILCRFAEKIDDSQPASAIQRPNTFSSSPRPHHYQLESGLEGRPMNNSATEFKKEINKFSSEIAPKVAKDSSSIRSGHL